MQPLQVGNLVGVDGRKVRTARHDENAAPTIRLFRTKRVDDGGSRLLGPVRPRFRHPTGGQRVHGHIRTHNQQAVIALRRSELDVGILPRLHTSRHRNARHQRKR